MIEADKPGEQKRAESDQMIGQRIADERKKKSLTQDQLGRRAGIKAQQVARYEGGAASPSVTTLRRLCDALAVSPNMLIYGAESLFNASSAYDRLAWGKGDEQIVPRIAVVISMLGIDDRRVVFDLIVRLAEARHGRDISKLLDEMGGLVDAIADHPGTRNAVDSTVDMFQADTPKS